VIGHPHDPERRCTYWDTFHYNDDWLLDVEDYCLRR